MTDTTMSESLAESEVEVIEYLLHEQTDEEHLVEVAEEQWSLELGERAALKLSFCRLGDNASFIINDLWPYLYRLHPEAFGV